MTTLEEARASVRQLTKEEAIAFHDSKEYEDWSPEKIANFQLIQDLLSIPFDVFQSAMETTLGRPVYTHEFGLAADRLYAELQGQEKAPTLEEIINYIPEEKKVILVTHNQEEN